MFLRMKKQISIAFFILVWITCSGQTFNVFLADSLNNSLGQITFKPDIRDGYIFYHLENLDNVPFKDCHFIADENFQRFIAAYVAIKNGEDFNIACEENCLDWQEDYTNLFFPTLIRAACKDCELPKELKNDSIR